MEGYRKLDSKSDRTSVLTKLIKNFNGKTVYFMQ